MRLVHAGLGVILTTALLGLASPASASVRVEQTTLSITPERVTLGGQGTVTQAIVIVGDRSLPITFGFDPVPPPGFLGVDATRRGGKCVRSGGAEYTCSGAGDVTLTYGSDPVKLEPLNGTSIQVTVGATGAHRVYGWIDVHVEAPAPTQTTPGETPPGDDGPSSVPPEVNVPSPLPTTSRSETTPPNVTPSLVADAGSGLGTLATGVGVTVGLVAFALAFVGLGHLRRRRDTP